MPTPQEMEAKFWKALKSDMTMMLGLDGVEDGHARPMTAQLEGERPPIWFFTSRDNEIVQKLGAGNRAIATFASKDHELFATVHGRLGRRNDRAVIDRLWNRYVAAWYEGGKDDPKLVLLRLMLSALKYGKMRRRFLPGSNCCSVPIRKKSTKTRSPR